MRALLLPVIFTALTLTLASCASPPTRGGAIAPGSLVWPSEPLAPRIAFVAAVVSPADAGIRKGFWGSLWSAIVGEEDTGILRPYGLHADSDQRIAVVDTGKRGVHLFDRKHGAYAFIKGPKYGSFLSPIAVTEDEAGMLYITDSATGTVYRCDPGNLEVTIFIQGGLKRPTGIAYNPRNRLIYVADTVAAQIVAFDLSGLERFRFGGEGSAPGRFNHPTDLAVDAKGRILVTDPLNSRIQIFSKDGVYQKGFGDAEEPVHFSKPKGIAADSEGHFYVCDALLDEVRVFDEEGRLLLSFGNAGSAPGEFWMPSGIFIDQDDVIYVADTYNKRIQIFRYLRQGGPIGTGSPEGAGPPTGRQGCTADAQEGRHHVGKAS